MGDYEYRGLMAQVWDLLRGDTSRWPDRFFYLDLIKKYGQPVLDVGCGTGRLLLDYLDLGIDIDGVDNSPEMLELCREKAGRSGVKPNLFLQPMEELELPRRYRTILIPSSSLQLIIETDKVYQALSRLREYLLPGGVIAASIMVLWEKGEPLESEAEHSAARPEDGAIIRRVSRSRFDPENELEHTEDYYQIIKDGVVVAEEVHQRSPATRSYTQAQIVKIFKDLEFKNIRLCHEFTQEPARPEDRLFTVLAEY